MRRLDLDTLADERLQTSRGATQRIAFGHDVRLAVRFVQVLPSAHGFNIAALSRRTGIPADTLRKWEERYAVLRPDRTTGGQRRYTELDVQRVEWLRERLAEGFRIGEASALLGGATTAARTPAELRRAIYDATLDADVLALRSLLGQSLAMLPLEQALTRVLEPVLRLVGDAWADGELTVAQEHLVSSAIRAQLERLLADVRGRVRGVAVLACVPGERHELGLLMLGTLLRADGWQVAYLGADAPVEDALDLAEQLEAELPCLSVTVREHASELERPVLPEGLTFALGGRAASDRMARRLGAHHVNDSLRRSVREIRRLTR